MPQLSIRLPDTWEQEQVHPGEGHSAPLHDRQAPNIVSGWDNDKFLRIHSGTLA